MTPTAAGQSSINNGDSTLGRKIPALDERLYSLDSDELAFILAETHIETESALKSHLFDLQAKAYKVHPYPCIRRFAFTKIKIARLPAYQKVLTLGRERDNAILLDIGCCFGNDTRKVVSDGFPLKGVVASDIHKAFWDLGHELFKSTPETFPVPFIWGDVFDASTLEPVAPFYDSPKTPMPPLSSLTSLNPLRGHISVIHASSLFHLFSEERQLQLARSLAGLLSPEPGSVMFGSQIGRSVKGFKQSSNGGKMFCHSPESWKELWVDQVFEQGKVEVEVLLKPIDRTDFAMLVETSDIFILVWSLTRL